MRSFRFSIAHLMLLIIIFGLGFAALHSPSALLASVWFSATLAALTLAVLAAVYRRGAQRAFWVGFASCGWVYFVLALGPWLHVVVGSFLVTTAALELLYPQITPPPPPGPAATITSVWSMWTALDLSGGIKVSVGNVWLMSSESFQRVGHSLFCLLFAQLGGVVTRRLAEQPEHRET
jgi:hypothetical protein